MHHNLINMRMLSLLAVGGIFCLMAGSAHAQRSSGRRVNGPRASIASTSSTSGTTSTSTSAASGTGTASCPADSSSSTSGTASGTGSTGTTTGAATSSLNSLSRSTASQVQTTSLGTGTVSAVRTAANQLAVQWVGNTSSVKAVYVAVLNANRQVLQQNAITQNPVQTNLTLGSTARYYGVQVVYANGTSSTMVSAIK